MTPESPAIRVRPLASMLDGNDPVEFVHRLLEAGYDRFYVKVPKGFRVSLLSIDPFPPGYQLLWPQKSTQGPVRADGNQAQIRYLQLDTSQLRDVLEYPPVALHQFSAGGLESALTHDGIPSIDFKYRKGLLGFLLPTERAIADKVPTEFDASSGAPVVVKTLNRIRSQYSYILHGVSFKDVFVEAPALSDALESTPTAKDVLVPACGDAPDDPYGLKDSSSLVYEILRKAYRNRGRARSEIDAPSLAAEFRELNAGYKKNPKPFNDGRHEFAATLANPGYNYSSGGLGEIDLPEEAVEVPADTFLDQDFINHKLRKLLYAACRWSGAKEPGLGGDREKLVDLLVGLGFFDREDSDQVQSLVYFITGEKYRRNKHKSDFRHIRSDRG
ncbi:hypothetical protein [Paraburkholderia sp. EG304]|uniref:hypothetical protein n=1 Tax=Paraburkholderia sp. EG304 TaxID=3237015 RepID=UPI00397CB9F6